MYVLRNVIIAFLIFKCLVSAEQCDPNNCKIENECVCVSGTSPIATKKTPQFVLLTFDDSVIRLNQNIYESILLKRKNPDGNPISATFFVTHEYSDYVLVNKFYNYGWEIAVQSITKSDLSYWTNAAKDKLVKEFSGQKLILSTFANIPNNGIQGCRTPFLQLSGDNTFQAMKESNLSYDSTWTAPYQSPLFPYTLDYESTQPCWIGSCPTKSFPKIWVSPINNIRGKDGQQCNVVTNTCSVNGTAEEIKNWLFDEFNRTYSTNRAPLKLLLPSFWFQTHPTGSDAIELLLDQLKTYNDVFVVSEWQLISWMKKPVEASKYSSKQPDRNAACKAISCRLMKGDDERYMQSCVPCPKVYPWLDNPLGE